MTNGGIGMFYERELMQELVNYVGSSFLELNLNSVLTEFSFWLWLQYEGNSLFTQESGKTEST